jgi:chaperone BCS1
MRSPANNFLDIFGYELDPTTFYRNLNPTTTAILATTYNRMYVDKGVQFNPVNFAVPLYKNNSHDPFNWYYYVMHNNADKTWDEYLCSNDSIDKLQLYLATLLEKYKNQPVELHCLSNANSEYRRLWTSKTFESLFFEQKPQIMSILDQFKTQKHVYQKRGLPYHLTFLLTGYPGCGKTSFIKCMARYFNRSIFKYHIDDKTTRSNFEATINAQFHNIIVFEDFDRLDTIVKIMSHDRNLSGLSDDDSKNVNSKNVNSKNLINDDTLTEHLKMLQRSYEDEKDTRSREQKFELFKKEYFDHQAQKRDKLDLQCLLNVIDGIQEHPGRILIFTCNHIERLDKAFLRPGRMDYILELKKCNHQVLYQILHHYYNSVRNTNVSARSNIDVPASELDVSCRTANQAFKFDVSCIPEYKYSPAEVMSVCKMYQHPKQVVKHLAKTN